MIRWKLWFNCSVLKTFFSFSESFSLSVVQSFATERWSFCDSSKPSTEKYLGNAINNCNSLQNTCKNMNIGLNSCADVCIFGKCLPMYDSADFKPFQVQLLQRKLHAVELRKNVFKKSTFLTVCLTKLVHLPTIFCYSLFLKHIKHKIDFQHCFILLNSASPKTF